MVARLAVLMPEFDGSVQSDPAVKVLQVAAWFVMLKQQEVNDNAVRILLAYAEKEDLDQLGALLNVDRLLIDAGDPATGVDPVYESDADFRERIQLAPQSFSVAGPATAYEFHARSADATIAGASASSPSPGTVLISVLSRLGDGTANANQLAAVEAALGKEVRPLTDNVVVASAQMLPYEIEAELTLFVGPDDTLVIAAAQERLNKYRDDSRRIGRDITRFGIFAALGVEGVSNVELVKPAADILCDETQCGNCVGLILRVAGRGE